jgi:hypothetical protein
MQQVHVAQNHYPASDNMASALLPSFPFHHLLDINHALDFVNGTSHHTFAITSHLFSKQSFPVARTRRSLPPLHPISRQPSLRCRAQPQRLPSEGLPTPRMAHSPMMHHPGVVTKPFRRRKGLNQAIGMRDVLDEQSQCTFSAFSCMEGR